MKKADFSFWTKIFKPREPIPEDEVPLANEAKSVARSFQMHDEDFRVEDWRPPLYQSTGKSAYYRLRHSYWTSACIEKYKSAICLVRPICKKWDQKSENFVRVPNHPIEQRIDNPNEYQTTSEFFGTIIENLWLTGNALISIKDTRTSGTVALEALNTDLVRLELGTKNGVLVEGYRIYKPDWGMTTASGRSKFVTRKDMIHIRLSNSERLDWGISPLEATKNVQETEADAVAFNRSLMANTGRPPFVLVSDDPLNKFQRRALQQAILEDCGRDRSGLPLVLTHGVKPVSIAQSPVELDYIKADRLNGERISSIFQIPSPLINITENATLANVKEFVKLFWSQGVLPKLEIIFDAISKYWVVPRWGGDYQLSFDLSAVPELMEHVLKKGEIIDKYINMGWTANELNVALELNLPYNEAGNIRMFDGQVVDWGGMEPPQSAISNSADNTGDYTGDGLGTGIRQSEPPTELTKKDLHDLWNSIEFSRKTLTDVFRRKALELTHRQLEKLSLAPVEAMEHNHFHTVRDEMKAEWEDVLNKVWYDSSKYFADSFADRYKRRPVETGKFSIKTTAKIKDFATINARDAAERLCQIYEEFITGSMEAGFSYEEATDNFRQKSLDVATTQSDIILEENVVCASNFGNQLGAEAAGCKKKTWREVLNRKSLGYDTIDGESKLLSDSYSNRTLFPGDPNGPPKQIKNYRCFETYE